MEVKAAAAAEYVRQKVLFAAVERKSTITVGDLLRSADADASGSLSYREFHSTLRRSLQLPSAVVGDAAIKTAFAVIDTSGDGELSREEFATYLRGGKKGGDADALPLMNCLDKMRRLTATANALRRTERLTVLRKRLRAAIAREGATVESFIASADAIGDGAWSPEEMEGLVREHLNLAADRCSDSDITLLFRELDVSRTGTITAGDLAEFLERKAEGGALPKKKKDRTRTDDLAVPLLHQHGHDPNADIVEEALHGVQHASAGDSIHSQPWCVTDSVASLPPLPPSPRKQKGRRR